MYGKKGYVDEEQQEYPVPAQDQKVWCCCKSYTERHHLQLISSDTTPGARDLSSSEDVVGWSSVVAGVEGGTTPHAHLALHSGGVSPGSAGILDHQSPARHLL